MKNALRPLAVLSSHRYAARRVCVKGNMFRTIVVGDRSGFLDWAGVEIGRALPHGIGSDIDCPSTSGRIGEPPAIFRHIRDQVKYRLRRTVYVSKEPQAFSEHGASISRRAIFDSFRYCAFEVLRS
jgi:hypothetical protein